MNDRLDLNMGSVVYGWSSESFLLKSPGTVSEMADLGQTGIELRVNTLIVASG